jgi:phosphoribosylformylglycinamidine synthase subunit PurS
MVIHVLVRFKEGVPDPEKQKCLEALVGAGYTEVKALIRAKYFVINIGNYDEGMNRAKVREMCRKLLANPVYEQFAIERVETTPEDRAKLLEVVNEITNPHGLRAEYLPGALSVGVMGDDRTYTPVIVLVGPHPGDEILQVVSSEISNRTLINRVTYDITPQP